MTDYTALCEQLRSLHIAYQVAGTLEAASVIETLLAERKVLMQLVETVQRERDKLIEQNKKLFDSALLAGQERDVARRAALEEAAQWCNDEQKAWTEKHSQHPPAHAFDAGYCSALTTAAAAIRTLDNSGHA